MSVLRTIALAAALVPGLVLIPAPISVPAVGPSPIAKPDPGAAVDWPQFRFNDERTGVNPFETELNPRNVPSLTLAWQAQLGSLVTFSSPAVVDGVVYIGSQTSFSSNDGKLNAFSASGCGSSVCAPLWQGLAGKESSSSPTVVNGKLYIGSANNLFPEDSQGRLYVFALP